MNMNMEEINGLIERFEGAVEIRKNFEKEKRRLKLKDFLLLNSREEFIRNPYFTEIGEYVDYGGCRESLYHQRDIYIDRVLSARTYYLNQASFEAETLTKRFEDKKEKLVEQERRIINFENSARAHGEKEGAKFRSIGDKLTGMLEKKRNASFGITRWYYGLRVRSLEKKFNDTYNDMCSSQELLAKAEQQKAALGDSLAHVKSIIGCLKDLKPKCVMGQALHIREKRRLQDPGSQLKPCCSGVQEANGREIEDGISLLRERCERYRSYSLSLKELINNGGISCTKGRDGGFMKKLKDLRRREHDGLSQRLLQQD